MLAASLVALVLSAEPAWKKLDSVDGIGLSSRELPGERVVELRAITITQAPPWALCAATRTLATKNADGEEIKLRKVLKDTPEEVVKYEQVSAPVVSDRDYALRLSFPPAGSPNCVVTFRTANELAPPLPKGFVRIEKLHGTWNFEAIGGGQTRATYTIFTDPAGSIPAAFVEGARRDTTVKYLKLALKIAEKLAAADAGAQPTP